MKPRFLADRQRGVNDFRGLLRESDMKDSVLDGLRIR